MIKFCFRFDDPSEISDHALEKKIIALFVNYDAKICFAVVPFKNKDNKFWPLTSITVKHIIDAVENNTVEIAQHGYSHVAEKMTAIGYRTEFSGISYKSQHTKIIEGRKHLSTIFQVPITGFVPPFNTYDSHTVKILSNNNYEYLSAGWDTPLIDKKKYNITILPRTCTLKNVSAALNEAEKYKNLSPIINIVLHHDDFEEFIHAHNSQDHPAFTNLKELETLLRNINRNTGMEISSISSICQSHKRLQNAQHISYKIWVEQLHWRLKHYFPLYIILTTSITKITFELIMNQLCMRPLWPLKILKKRIDQWFF